MAANTPSFSFVSPVGRIVQGDVFAMQDKDQKTGQPLVVKNGPNKGQPTSRNFIALAVPKTVNDTRQGSPTFGQMVSNWEFDAWYAQISAFARQQFPQLFNAQGQCTNPRFAWKIADGDGNDVNGQPNSGKTGFAGHWVIKFSSTFAPKVLMNGAYVTEGIKRGYYVAIAGNCQSNAMSGSEVPGIFMNQEAVQFVGYGEEIRGGIDAVGVFAAHQSQAMPAGMSTVPVAQPGVLAAPAPTMPALPGAAPAAPAAPSPTMPAAPNHAFVNNAMYGAPALQPTAAAGAFTLEQYKAAGYTEERLLADGLFVRAAPAPAMPAAPSMPAMPAMPVAPAPVGLQPTAAAGAFTLEQYKAAGYTEERLLADGLFVRG